MMRPKAFADTRVPAVISTRLRLSTLAVLLTLATTPSWATTLMVDSQIAEGGDGTSWSSALNSIQGAIDQLDGQEGEVWVKAGTYTGDGENVIEMAENIDLYGGFAGTETTLDQRDWVLNRTIIDGESERRGVYCNANSTLNGFSITNGYTTTSAGAGIYTRQSPTIENCTFNNNTTINSTGAGGGAYISGSAKFTNCTFSNNSSSNNGGGLFIYGMHSRPIVINCTFENNNAQIGGAIASYNAIPNIIKCTITNNRADWGAGVSTEQTNYLFSDVEPPTIIDGCTIENNTAKIEGGGIYNRGDEHYVMISNSTITSNTSEDLGGGIYNDYSRPILSACNISFNSAREYGGGMYNENSSPTINNSLFVSNLLDPDFDHYMQDGIAIYNEQSNPTFTNCTVTNHPLPGLTSSIYNDYSTPVFTNCILWGGYNYIFNNETNSTKTVTYSCIDNTIPGTGNFHTHPLLADPDNGDYRLLPDSPCIDAGTAEGAPDTDIRGIARPQDNGIDMGAYEFYRPVDQVEGPTTLIADLSVPTDQDGWFFNKPEMYRDIEAQHDQQSAIWDINVSGNEMTFGYLESPVLSVLEDEEPVKGNSLTGETGPGYLYRATLLISSDLEDSSEAPVIRVRTSSESFQRSDLIVVTSEQEGDLSPDIEGRLYTTYFQMPENESNFRLDLDVLNFNPNDSDQATVYLRYAEVEYLGAVDQLGDVTSVISENFQSDGTLGWGNHSIESDQIAAPDTFSFNIGEGLLIRGMEPAVGKQEPGNPVAIFGCWAKKCICYPLEKSLYRISWTVGTDAEDISPEALPTFRLRFNDASMKFASMVNIDSVAQNHNLPSVSNPVIYDSWFMAPPEVIGNNWELSFDYLYIDKPAPNNDDPTAALILQAVEVMRYDVP